jgi:hypothetical protein
MSHASPLPLRLPLRNFLKTRKARSEASHHIPLRMRDHVRVGVQGDRYAEVTEDFLEDLRVFARLQPQSCEGVSEVVAARSAAQKLTVVSPRNICVPLRRQLPSIVLRGRVGSIHRRVERGWRSLRPNRHVRRSRDTSGPDIREFRTSTSFGEPST